MITYEVNITVSNSIMDDYISWLVPHVQDMLLMDGFVGATWSKEVRTSEPDRSILVVNYQVEDIDKLDNYFEHNAASMRNAIPEKFMGKFTIIRRVLEVLDTFHTEAIIVADKMQCS